MKKIEKVKPDYRPKDYLDAPLSDGEREEAYYLLKDARKNKVKSKRGISKKQTKPTLKEIERDIDDSKIDLSIAKDQGLTTTVKDLERRIKFLNKQKQSMEKPKKTSMAHGGTTMKNNPPVGSLPEEVADDIPAMISEGEFVIPADVVRYVEGA